MQDNIQVIADALVTKLRTIPANRAILFNDLKPSLCGDEMFDRAIAVSRRNVKIEGRVWNGDLWFRGLGR
jgi:hypothetical protein